MTFDLTSAAQSYVVFAVASSAVRALPEPIPTSHPLYRWLYVFTHALMANWDKVHDAAKQTPMVISAADSINPPRTEAKP